MTTLLQPLQKNLRDTNLDILRGFAIAGVLFVYCAGDMGIAENYNSSALDKAIKWFNRIMVEGRMYGTLIFVFGIGFSVQLQKANEKGSSIVPVFSRRLVGLLLIGFMHAFFVSNRDVLMFYAIAGFALLPARNFSSRQLLIYILLALLLLLEYYTILRAVGVKEVIVISSWVPPNDLSSYFGFLWQFFKEYHQMYEIYFHMLFYFLLGYYTHKSGLMKKIESDKKLRSRIILSCLILSSLLGYLYYGWLPSGGSQVLNSYLKSSSYWVKHIIGDFIQLLLYLMTLSFVTLYAVIFISINSLKRGEKFLQPLAVFGQMAMSNYLISSILIVSYALWFNKFNNMPPFEGTVSFLIIFSFQLIFSTWWLKRYHFGPFEYLLRSFTYWKWQPMKKKENIQNTEMAL